MKDRGHETERAWIEINMENLRHNVRVLQKAMRPGCELMAVVKADAYGHGDALIASELNRMGIRAFAVATIEEGIRLREQGIQGEILILGYTCACRAFQLKEYDLTQTLISFAHAESLNRQGIGVKVHIKIDTGMHRLGIPGEEFAAVRKVFSMENLNVCGIFTHLSCPESRRQDDIAFTRKQIDGFFGLTDALKGSGAALPKLHIQSTYGFLDYPDISCDYVRIGIALYGVYSSREDDTVLKPDLRPVLSLKSRVVLIRPVPAGESIGYGRSFTAGRDIRIGILPVGYGDGYPRSLSNGKGIALINGHAAPVIGRICMDQLAVDVTDVENVSVGDIATLIGTEGGGELSAPAVAGHFGSISNELLCRMGARLPAVALYHTSAGNF